MASQLLAPAWRRGWEYVDAGSRQARQLWYSLRYAKLDLELHSWVYSLSEHLPIESSSDRNWSCRCLYNTQYYGILIWNWNKYWKNEEKESQLTKELLIEQQLVNGKWGAWVKNSKPSLCGHWSNCNIDILSYEFRSQLTAQTFCCLFLFLRLVFLYSFTKKKKKRQFCYVHCSST